MKINFPTCLSLVLKDEGGFVNDPQDPGGATDDGVVQHLYNAYRQQIGLAEQSVKLVSQDELRAIYRQQFWGPLNCDALPPGVDYVTFDYGVNSGPFRAAETLQWALGVSVDGHIGLVTIAAANATTDRKALIDRMDQHRIVFLESLPTWSHFGGGWDARVSRVSANGVAMLSNANAGVAA